MAKKGTPEYEIWRVKFLQKRALLGLKKSDFIKNPLVSILSKKLKDSLIEENDLLVILFLSGVENETLSVAALDAAKKKFNIDDASFEIVVGLFKSLSKDILKRRLLGIYNFEKVNSNPSSYPEDFRVRYSRKNFSIKYGYNLESVLKAKSL